MTQAQFQEIAPTLPALPGIYRYYDAAGQLLYVGKAKHIRKRVSSYFNKTLASYKTHELVKRIEKIETTIVNSEQDAFCWRTRLSSNTSPSSTSTLKTIKPILISLSKTSRFQGCFSPGKR
jgi:excinuclease ABC subunit C